MRKAKSASAMFGALALAWLAAPAGAADQALIDAARKEGRLTWYTALVIDQFALPAARAFEKKYGIKVDPIRTTSIENTLRISNEGKAGRIFADVFDGFGPTQLIKEGLVDSYVPESGKKLAPEFRDPRGYWIAGNYYVLTPGYNSDLVKPSEAPKTLEDFLDPKWRGKLVWGTTPSPTSAAGFIGLALAEFGEEKGMEYLRKLAAQRITPVSSSGRALLNQVIAGEFPIAMLIFNNHAVISKAKGAPSEWIKLSPSIGLLSVFSIVRGAPHPNSAKLFLEFLLSTEGQQIVRDADYMPVDPAVPPNDPSLRPDGVTFRAHFFRPDEIDGNLMEWGKIYTEVFK